MNENQIYIDWDFNTYELAIIIKPERVIMTDVANKDGSLSKKEMAARGRFEILRKKILKLLNDEEMKKP